MWKLLVLLLRSLEKMELEVSAEEFVAVHSVNNLEGTVTPRAASAKDPELDRVEEEDEEGGEDGEREEEKQREEEEKARRAKEDLNSLSDLDELLFCRSVNQVKV